MWAKIVGGSVAALVAAHFYLLHQINQVADDLVQAASMFANASHRGGYYTWDGNLGIRNFPSSRAPAAVRGCRWRNLNWTRRTGGGCCSWPIRWRPERSG